MTLTKDILRAAIKPLRIQASPEFIEELLEGFCTFFPKYQITTPKRIAAFLSQAAHETCKFRWFTELGNRCYFSKYEPCTCIGKRLGNKELGHGFKYRGRGIFQLTGLFNYKHYGELTGLDLVHNPEIAAEPIIACHIACEYWKQH